MIGKKMQRPSMVSSNGTAKGTTCAVTLRPPGGDPYRAAVQCASGSAHCALRTAVYLLPSLTRRRGPNVHSISPSDSVVVLSWVGKVA